MRLPSRRDGIVGGGPDQQVRLRFASADMDHRSFGVRRGLGSRAGEDAVPASRSSASPATWTRPCDSTMR